jgi:Mg2+ and Co2+ transporter CorA
VGCSSQSINDAINAKKKEKFTMWTIIVILLILWLFGFFGRNISPRFPRTGNWIHTLVVIALVLVVLQVLGVV